MPADIAAALAALPAPRLLVTTPVHLRALVQPAIALPDLAGIVCATAPLCRELAALAETSFRTRDRSVRLDRDLCRRTPPQRAAGRHAEHYAGVNLRPQPDGTLVTADWFEAPVTLQDLVELLPERRFRLRGRNS